MNNLPEDFILGSKAEHFRIVDNTITQISEEISELIGRRWYKGPLKICFPGCENIKTIGAGMCWIDYFIHISSIDLSYMTGLEKIGHHAFVGVGRANKNFSEINLSCPNLKEIHARAFEQVGRKSKFVKLILNCPNLIKIGQYAFVGVCEGIEKIQQDNEKVQQDTVILDLSKCIKLQTIDEMAFAEYHKNTTAKCVKVKFPPNIKEFGLCCFMNMFKESEKIIFRLINQHNLLELNCSYFTNKAEQYFTIKNCRSLVSINCFRRQHTNINTRLHLNVSINSCPNLKNIFGHTPMAYLYYEHINKQYLSYISSYNFKFSNQIQNYDESHCLQYIQDITMYNNLHQLQLKDIDYKTQKIQQYLDQIEKLHLQLQQEIDLQNQIINRQHKQCMFLKNRIEKYNQQFPTEDDQ